MNVIYPFSQDCIELLQQLNHTKQLSLERLYIALVLLFCHSAKKQYYAHNLLYRTDNISTTTIINGIEINDEVLFYLNDIILYRPLQLANHLKDEPNNAHKLLSRFCYLHSDNYWQTVTVARYANPVFIESHQLSFKQLQRDLKKLTWQKTEQSDKYGAIYLSVAQSGIKLPEALCLAHIIEVCPKPLKTDFQHDELFKQLFHRVLEHLNERYSLLRSCGLTPQLWLNKNVLIKKESKPLSIDQLRELKQLRELAMQKD
jgi:hypothetical protein